MSRVVGVLICLGAVVAGAAFIAGIVLQSDKVVWAIMVPVALAVAVVLLLGFWIGWIMAVTKIEAPPEASEEPEPKG
jgi:ribose/xylose/arabinose/galactoside ABC-type transport system permease subunit